jgi:peptidoglycan/LPS O-acetylase OafA/YrhL
MFGTLRLALAILVALSHVGVTVFGLNPGVFAVVIFYIISGWVVDSMLRSGMSLGDFALERVLRIVPAYAAVLLLTAMVAFTILPRESIFFLTKTPTLGDWIANASVIPLNFFMWTGQDRFTLIPPAWSLGLELQYYALAGLLLRHWSGPAWAILAAASLAVWLAAAMGLIHTDWWGYRLLPGTLFMFLAGAAIHAYGAGKPGQRAVILIAGGGAIAVLFAISVGYWKTAPFNRETALGVLVGLGAIMALARRPRRIWDDRLGAFAYPVFLNHFLLLWLFMYFGITPQKMTSEPFWLGLWLLSVLAGAAMLHYAVESPLVRMRRRLRERRA